MQLLHKKLKDTFRILTFNDQIFAVCNRLNKLSFTNWKSTVSNHSCYIVRAFAGLFHLIKKAITTTHCYSLVVQRNWKNQHLISCWKWSLLYDALWSLFVLIRLCFVHRNTGLLQSSAGKKYICELMLCRYFTFSSVVNSISFWIYFN